MDDLVERQIIDLVIRAAMDWTDTLPNPHLDVSVEAECRLENCIFALRNHRAKSSAPEPALPFNVGDEVWVRGKVLHVGPSDADVEIGQDADIASVLHADVSPAIPNRDDIRQEPTPQAIEEFIESVPSLGGDPIDDAIEVVRAALAHFNAPPAKPQASISDEEIIGAWRKHFGITEFVQMGFTRPIIAFARALLASHR